MPLVEETVPRWQRTLNMGGDLDRLRELVQDIEAEFRLIVEGLNNLDPSDLPDRVAMNLENMGLLPMFSEFCKREGLTVPDTQASGWGAHWVIAPTV